VSGTFRILALAAAAGCALSGCGERAVSGSGKRAAAVETRPAPGAAMGDTVLVAVGNEPFWNVKVGAREIRYTEPEHPEGFAFPPADGVQAGEWRVYRTRRERTAGKIGPLTLELRIRQAPCSDGMSDRSYDLAAELALDDETLTGCAYYEVGPPNPR
jgi:uncharacterized membrane protein